METRVSGFPRFSLAPVELRLIKTQRNDTRLSELVGLGCASVTCRDTLSRREVIAQRELIYKDVTIQLLQWQEEAIGPG